MLSEKEQTEILQNFPTIELSYENITHKKVFSCQLAMAIPEGKKYFTWFSKKNARNVCIFMEISAKTKTILNIHLEYMPNDNKDLYNGTILYGTVFQTNKRDFFCTENILYTAGINICNKSIDAKFKAIHSLFERNLISKIPYFSSFITFGVPLIYSNFSQEMNSSIKDLPYKINEIHFYTQNKPKNYYSMKYVYQNLRPKIIKTAVFCVKPDLQNDIYHLYGFDSETRREYLHDTAYISDYKTSVMMNGLFRNIKENINLDALEESDDEEEFENDKLDKYVDLKKFYHMKCFFNNKFKKWEPVEIVENCKTIVKKNELIR